VSQQYEPVDLKKLPAYLPAERPPVLEVYKVYRKIQGQKKTKSTLIIDIPENLRKEAAEFLAEPLTNIYNHCLKEGVYPKIWKQEWCTPVPKKKTTLKLLKDVRKIASTSDFSKIFEYFLLQFVLEDVSDKMSVRQYGGKKGVGTEHLLVTLIDRIKKLLDQPNTPVVILSSYDWKGAFERIDPTEVALKMIKLGIRSSIVKVVIDFLRDRKMELKMNGHTSPSLDLIGGGPQGSLIGQLMYLIASDDVGQEIPEEDKFQYIDDLSAVEAIYPQQKLIEYDFYQHVASDIAIGQRFLPQNTFKTQSYNNAINDWSEHNKMVINQDKSNYMVISRSTEPFSTRLDIKGTILERKEEIVHLGMWLTESLCWERHISEICKKAYPRVRMLSRLKYLGVSTEDLLELYCLHIRSLTEYCSTAFHSTLSLRLENKLEAIQKTCLRVILDVMFVDYNSALEMCGLRTLQSRRESRSLLFAVKCTRHSTQKSMFPLNPTHDTHLVRKREKFLVNKARTHSYFQSTIPYLQRRLNLHAERLQEIQRRRHKRAPGGGGGPS
jgi:hypothetical protein